MGRPFALTLDLEIELYNYIVRMRKLGFGLTVVRIRKVAFQLSKSVLRINLLNEYN